MFRPDDVRVFAGEQARRADSSFGGCIPQLADGQTHQIDGAVHVVPPTFL